MPVRHDQLLAEALGQKPKQTVFRRFFWLMFCLAILAAYLTAVASLATADYRLLVLRDHDLLSRLQAMLFPDRAVVLGAVYRFKELIGNHRKLLPVIGLGLAFVGFAVMHSSRRQWR